MLDFLMELLENLIVAEEPVKTILISFVLTIIACVSVIIIGAAVEKLEIFEMKFLSKLTSPKKALFIEDRLTFPGTILHECAHAVTAWATGAKVTKVKFLTFFDAHKLGCVYFQPRGNMLQQRFQLSLTSCAPVLVGMSALNLLMYINTAIAMPWYFRALSIYLMISIFNHMTMSTADIKNYLRGLISVFPVVFLIFYAVRLFNYR